MRGLTLQDALQHRGGSNHTATPAMRQPEPSPPCTTWRRTTCTLQVNVVVVWGKRSAGCGGFSWRARASGFALQFFFKFFPPTNLPSRL